MCPKADMKINTDGHVRYDNEAAHAGPGEGGGAYMGLTRGTKREIRGYTTSLLGRCPRATTQVSTSLRFEIPYPDFLSRDPGESPRGNTG